jgi:hypothetical protein
VRRGDLEPALAEHGDGIGVADRAGATGHDADPAGGQRQPKGGALAVQQAACGEVLLQGLALLGDFAGAGRGPHDPVDLELQAAERPPVLQGAADHDEVAGPQQLGDGRVAELLA